MYNIIYMGSYNSRICDIVCQFKNIKVKAFIVDSSISSEEQKKFRTFWHEKEVPEVVLNEEAIKDIDMIFVCGYTKIIKSDLLEKCIFVNIHAGNLPRWRGISANAWSILNGEYNVAYTLHRITDVADGGPIYYKYEYYMKDNEKYGDARKRLELMLQENLEDVFEEICSGKNEGATQEGKYIYCNSLRRDDGVLSVWNYTSREIRDWYRVLGYPYGTGLYFRYKQKEYEIIDLELDSDFAEGITTVGAVVYKYDKWVWIKTKDTAVKIGIIKDSDGNFIEASSLLNIGIRL